MEHRYPRRLIPKHSFCLIDASVINETMKDFFLLRKIKKDDSFSDIRSRLKSQFIPTTFKNGISVVLLSVLKKEDVGWNCKKPCGKNKGYEKKWVDNNMKAIFPKNKHLYYQKNAEFCGYKIKKILEYKTVFPVVVKDQNGNPVERKDLIKLKVVHEPLCSNYWHCELFLYRLNGDDNSKIEKLSIKETERAGNLILDDLTDMAYLSEAVDYKRLERKYYRKREIK